MDGEDGVARPMSTVRSRVSLGGLVTEDMEAVTRRLLHLLDRVLDRVHLRHHYRPLEEVVGALVVGTRPAGIWNGYKVPVPKCVARSTGRGNFKWAAQRAPI